jgi:hypothetical protein
MEDNVELEKAKESLVNILRREQTILGQAPEEYKKLLLEQKTTPLLLEMILENAMYVRKNIPEFISKGTGQFLIRLTDKYLAKFSVREETSTHITIISYHPNLENNVPVLKEIFPNLYVADHHYFGMLKKNNFTLEKGHECVITNDLTENGKYELLDAKILYNTGHNKTIQTLSNSSSIKSELYLIISQLMEIKSDKNSKYALTYNRHVNERYSASCGSMDEAALNMFFTQIDKTTREGKLIAGDLDHIFIYKRQSTVYSPQIKIINQKK